MYIYIYIYVYIRAKLSTLLTEKGSHKPYAALWFMWSELR